MAGNSNTDILIAGAVAAFTVDLLVYPLDTLKTRIQSPDYKRLYTSAPSSSSTGVSTSTSTGRTLAAAKPKPNAALFRGLYQGVGSVIIATLPSSGAFFTTYERTKAGLTTLNQRASSAKDSGVVPTPLIHATASSLAELVSCAILTPAEVIKQNAQMVQYGSKTNATLQTLQKFRANPLALWRGYTALAGRNLPFTALQFPLFERLKEGIRERRRRRGVLRGGVVESGCITAVSAGSAGAVAAVITTPVDVVKTRIMLAAADDAVREVSRSSSSTTNPNPSSSTTTKSPLVDAVGKSVSSSKATVKTAAKSLNPLLSAEQKGKRSAWKIGQEIVAEKGWVGLWRGGALRGVWTFVGAGLYLGVYEAGRGWLGERREGRAEEEDGG